MAQRIRNWVALLADIGGAVAAVAAGLGIVAAAVVVLTDLLPPVPLGLIALGVGLIVFGFSVHLLRKRWVTPPPAPPPAPDAAESDDDPFERAQALRAEQEAAQEEQARTEEAQAERDRVLQVRRAQRKIREELLDARAVLWRMKDGRVTYASFSSSEWNARGSVLLDQDDPEPYRCAADAWRQVGRVNATRDEDGDVPTQDPMVNADIQGAIGAIDDAVAVLLESELSPS